MSEIGTSRPRLEAPALWRALRAPDTGFMRQGLRFALAGGTVALIYLTTTTVLAEVVGVPFQAALAIGFSVGIMFHFTLQRRFVWAHGNGFALPLRHQAGRYLVVVAAQYGVTAASTSLLPPIVGVSAEVVYLMTLTVVIGANFLVFRHGIFHAKPAASDRELRPPAEPGGAGRGLRGTARRLPKPALIDAAIATLAVLLIASPVLFTRGGFCPEFTNDLWLAGYQQHVIAAHLYPTLFLQTQQGVFFPLFAFYGGSLFAITGALGAALGGSTVLAFEVMTVAAMAAAYGGLFWLARQLGVRGLLAHAPALVFVTSAYYIADLYGRGDWAEFMAVSALPLLIAAALRVVRGRWRTGPVVCLVAASTVFSGSHNITLLVGSTLAVLALACYWLLSGRSRKLPWRGIAGALGLMALGAGLNGWFFVPDLIYGHNTIIGGEDVPWSASAFFNTFGVIFDPLRTMPSQSEAPALYVQAPVLALIWGLLALPLVWRERRLRAGVATALIVLAGLLVLIMSSAAWSLLPTPYDLIQLPFRLQTYVALACAGLVLLGALALTRRAERGRATRADRGLRLGLGLAVAFGVALGAWQLWVPNTRPPEGEGRPPTYSNRADALRSPATLLPASWYWPDNIFDDRSLPVLAATASVTFPPAAVHDDRFVGTGSVPPGSPFATNIVGGPYLVHVAGGVRVVGRTAEGNLVLQRVASGSRPVPVEVRAQLNAPVVLGRIVTAASAALLLALALATVVRRRRRRTATHPSGYRR